MWESKCFYREAPCTCTVQSVPHTPTHIDDIRQSPSPFPSSVLPSVFAALSPSSCSAPLCEPYKPMQIINWSYAINRCCIAAAILYSLHQYLKIVFSISNLSSWHRFTCSNRMVNVPWAQTSLSVCWRRDWRKARSSCSFCMFSVTALLLLATVATHIHERIMALPNYSIKTSVATNMSRSEIRNSSAIVI